jgi:NAD(P)-dependent dehydrogenase (short-subunit alcohol dehydrogenase family)
MNIRVNAVAPGIIATERFKELYECDGDKIDGRIVQLESIRGLGFNGVVIAAFQG